MSKIPLGKRIRNKMRDIRHNLSARILGTRHYEKEWSSKEYDEFYWNSLNHPHRDLIVAAVKKYDPNSLLEIGCNSGPNLYRLAKEFPSARLNGIDISPKAIEMGRELLKKESISNVELAVGQADDLRIFPDKSFDLVLSDAVLIYIGRDKIVSVADEMLRVARKAIVLVEWHDIDSRPEGAFLMKRGYWVRNYESLFKNRPRVSEIRFKKITREVWDDDCWSSYGNIIEVSLKNA